MTEPSALAGLRSPGRGRSTTAALDRLVSLFGERMVRFAEEALGEELDARIDRIRHFPNEAGFDPFGFDPSTARYALALSEFLHLSLIHI